MNEQLINDAKARFGALLEQQLSRVSELEKQPEPVDYSALSQIIIGLCPGDGIGPVITAQAEMALRKLLKPQLASGKVVFKHINGLTIENRLKVKKAIPDDVLGELKACHVILKGPTTTPKAGDGSPNLESANVGMRKALDLFANVRPVKVPEEGIDWTFFRENTEGAYALGSQGFAVGDGLALDFCVATDIGTKRIIKAAFDFAKANGYTKVTAVTKANIIKTTDGLFLRRFYEIAKLYPGIETDDWFIDIMTAKLIDKNRRKSFQVMVMPNLYGDILTDEAAEFQGGVGTAGSANIGSGYAMFEAIHGSAPRMLTEGRAKFADPSSMLRAAVMLLSHIGFIREAEKLEAALDACTRTERRHVLTGYGDGCTNEVFMEYLLEKL